MSPNALSRPSRRAVSVRIRIALTAVALIAVTLIAPSAPTARADESPVPSAEAFQACSVAEQRASQRWWYFGARAGLDFGVDGGTPTPVTGGLSASEGTTVVTDPDGALLFYSNAGSIYNRNHVVMAGGSGLTGNDSAIQTVAAFPAVGSMNRYFVVTTNASGLSAGGRLYYSEVDMSLANGLGAVVAGRKNIAFGAATSSSEALAAVPTADGTGFWAITTKYNSTQVLAYRFDGTGLVSQTPVTSTVSSPLTNVFGSIEFDSAYRQAVITSASQIRVLDFDAATGAFAERLVWPRAGGYHVYHAAFSPSGEHVYVSEYRGPAALYRYRVAGAGSSADVIASRQHIATSSADAGQVRPAPDGRMYWATMSATALHVVADPDAATPTYLASGLPLAARTSSRLGLPQMVTGCERRAPALTLTKTSDAATLHEPGDELTYTITATNTGTHDHTDDDPTLVADDLTGTLRQATWAGGLTASVDGVATVSPVFDANTGMLTWRGPLARGETVTITYRVVPTPGSELLIRNIVWNPRDPDDLTPPTCTDLIDGKDRLTGEGCARDVSVVFHPGLDVDLGWARPDGTGTHARVGDVITYTVTVRNPGAGHFAEPASDIAGNPLTLTHDLTDLLDDAGLVGTPSGGATIVDGVLTWTGPLAPGATHEITVTVRVTGDGDGMLTHEACAVGDSRDPATGVLTACDALSLPVDSHWSVAKRALTVDGVPLPDDAVLAPGDQVRFEITATATGRHDFAGVVLHDDLTGLRDRAEVTGDALLTVGDATPVVVGIGPDDRIETAPFTLPAGSSAMLSYAVTVGPDATAGALRNTAFGTGAHAPTTCASAADPCVTQHAVELPPAPTEVAPARPAWNETCEAPPWLDLPVQPGVRYDVHGEIAAGASVTIVATAQAGHVLTVAPGWTVAEDGVTASFTVTFPSCLGGGAGTPDPDGDGGGSGATDPDGSDGGSPEPDGDGGNGSTPPAGGSGGGAPDEGGSGGGTPDEPGTGSGGATLDGGTPGGGVTPGGGSGGIGTEHPGAGGEVPDGSTGDGGAPGDGGSGDIGGERPGAGGDWSAGGSPGGGSPTPDAGTPGSGTPTPDTGGGETDPDGGSPGPESPGAGSDRPDGEDDGSSSPGSGGSGALIPVGSPGSADFGTPVCVAGVVTMPTLRVRLVPGARYEVTGSSQPGGTIVLTAYAEPGYVLDPIAAWTTGNWRVSGDASHATRVHVFPSSAEVCGGKTGTETSSDNLSGTTGTAQPSPMAHAEAALAATGSSITGAAPAAAVTAIVLGLVLVARRRAQVPSPRETPPRAPER